MSLDLRRRLFAELDRLVLIDPHTHINALDPASHTLADILGYHYYTELAHSAGLAREQIEEPGLPPDEKVRRLMQNLGPIENTIQYSWLAEMCVELFGLAASEVTAANWRGVFDAALAKMQQPDWAEQVLAASRLEAVFLTNDFDDRLEGFDSRVYIPCLRTDDLVFHLAKPEVRSRLQRATGMAAADAQSLRAVIGELFRHFKSRGARACAISLPPDFTPTKVSAARANTALAAINADESAAAESHRKAIGHFVFWTLAEMCADYRLPFDLMIGVNRGVYEAGVHQGRDLYDSRVSLVQYTDLFNAFPQVTFPISVLASVTNQELTSYAWIFPNVVTNGHWWYSNTPTFIEHDLAARLEAVPQTKQIGYYSDMYKLEFGLPKFAMYKRILAKVLAERFVIDRGWTEEQAVELGRKVLRGNVERIFRWNEDLTAETPALAFAGPIRRQAMETAATGESGVLRPAEDIRIEPQSDDEDASSSSIDLWNPDGKSSKSKASPPLEPAAGEKVFDEEEIDSFAARAKSESAPETPAELSRDVEDFVAYEAPAEGAPAESQSEVLRFAPPEPQGEHAAENWDFLKTDTPRNERK